MRRVFLGLVVLCTVVPATPAQESVDRAEREREVSAHLAALERAVQGGDADGVVAAIIRLVVEPHTRAVKPVARLCSDPDDAVAVAACEAIAWLGAKLPDPLELQRAVNILAASWRLARDRPRVAVAACTGLGHLRHRDAVPPLLDAVGATDASVAAAAGAALTALTGQTHATPAAWQAWWATAGATFVPAPVGSGADGPRPPKPPTPAAGDPVSRAVDRAADYLLARHPVARPYVDREAIHLLAIAYAGRDNDPRFRRAVDVLAEARCTSVYETALQLMVLAKDDPRRWQQAIARRAWWLVNAQGQRGAWSYGGTDLPVPTQWPRAGITRSRFKEAVATGSLKADDDPMATILIERTAPWAPLPAHDLSNTQIAVLALYAAEQAHIRCPEETWERIGQAFRDGSVRGGGWSYIILKMAVPTASMTAGGIGCLAMLDEIFDTPTPERRALKRAGWRLLDRLGPFAEWRNGRTDQRGDQQSVYFYYWLYSLERAGMLERRAKLGGRDWFAVLSDYLVKAQRPDGAWGPPDNHTGRTIIFSWDAERAICTSLAVLFLARAAPLRRTQLTKAIQHGPSTPADGDK